MSDGAHESYADSSHGAGPSNRKFGLTLGALFAGLAIVRWLLGSPSQIVATLAAAGGMLIILGAVAPALLGWFNRAWLRLGLAMAAVMTPVVMLLIFALVFTPMALGMRLSGRDKLGLQRKPAGASY